MADEDELEELVRYYFSRNYDYRTIPCFLGVQHVQLCYSFYARLDLVYLIQLGLFFVGIFRSEFLELILVDYTESKEESSSRAFRSRL